MPELTTDTQGAFVQLQHRFSDLLAVEGMDEPLAFELASHGITTRENLADLATDEFMELGIEGIDEEQAAGLIMAARAVAAA